MATATLHVDRTIEVRAPREVVFDLLTEPDEIRRWWPIVRTFEPRVGGRLEVDAQRRMIAGEVTELERPHALAYTWQCLPRLPGRDPGKRLTEVRFALGESLAGTALRLTHGPFADDAHGRAHDRDWARCLPRLKAVAEAVRAP